VVLAGFGSHHGSVIAGKSWGAPMERMKVPEARMGSWEDVLHQARTDDELLLFDQSSISDEFRKPRGHRAIGVVYNRNWKATAIMFQPSFPSATTPFYILTNRKPCIHCTLSLKNQILLIHIPGAFKKILAEFDHSPPALPKW
jgi:hypothetical protein